MRKLIGAVVLAGLLFVSGFLLGRWEPPPVTGLNRDSLRLVVLADSLRAMRVRAEASAVLRERGHRIVARADSFRARVRTQAADTGPAPESGAELVDYYQARIRNGTALLDLTLRADSIVQDSLHRIIGEQAVTIASLIPGLARADSTIRANAVSIARLQGRRFPKWEVGPVFEEPLRLTGGYVTRRLGRLAVGVERVAGEQKGRSRTFLRVGLAF